MGYMTGFQLPVVVGILLLWGATTLLANGIGGSFPELRQLQLQAHQLTFNLCQG